MRILIWLIVAIVIVGGLAWFLSPNKKTENTSDQTLQNNQQQQNNLQITESGSIESEDKIFEEIDSALADLE